MQDCNLRANFFCIDDPAALIIEGDAFIAEKFSAQTTSLDAIA
jgi:hypothetical protein